MLLYFEKSCPALITPLPAWISSLPTNIFPNKHTPNVSNSILRNAPLCSLVLCSIVLVIPFINQPKSSKDLTIFIMFFISSFDIISFFIPDPNVFLFQTLMFFINQPKSSKDLTIFIMFFISSFDIISFFIPDPNVFYQSAQIFKRPNYFYNVFHYFV